MQKSKRNSGFILHFIVSYLSVLGFSFALGAAILRFMNIEMNGGELLPLLALFSFLFMLVVLYPFQTLVFLGGCALLYILLLLMPEGSSLAHFSKKLTSSLFSYFEYGKIFFGQKPGTIPVANYFRLLSVFLSLVSVLLLWLRPMPLVALITLAVPIFYTFRSESGLFWILLIGFSSILLGFKQRPSWNVRTQEVFNLPSIPLILFTLLLTYFLSGLGPESVYKREVSKRVNDTMRSVKKEWVVREASFGGERLAFYKNRSPIGNYVAGKKTPYLKIEGPSDSFYLTASKYKKFNDNEWIRPNDLKQVAFEGMNSSFSESDFWKPLVLDVKYLTDERQLIYYSGPVQSVLPAVGYESEIKVIDGGYLWFEKKEVPGYSLFGYYTPIEDGTIERALIKENVSLDELKPKTDYKKEIERLDPTLYKLVYSPYLTYGEAVDRLMEVRDYLRTFTYSLRETAINVDETFFERFLSTKRGYCVHFATAMTLLAEEMGFSASYTEGFIVPESEKTIRTITSESAHAWSSVKLYNLGEIPIDATPQARVDALQRTPEATQRVTTEPVTKESPNKAPMDKVKNKETSPLAATEKKEVNALLLLLLVPFYLLLSLVVFKLRRNSPFLKAHFRDRKVLIRRLVDDLEKIDRLKEKDARKSESTYAFMERILGYHPPKKEEKNLLLETIDDIYYREQEISEESIDNFLRYRLSLEERVKREIPWITWFLRRFLYKSGKIL
ncbi:transglutaminase-like domain-containing protein [Guggenheimella bovis]